jgi:hypothetical protein
MRSNTLEFEDKALLRLVSKAPIIKPTKTKIQVDEATIEIIRTFCGKTYHIKRVFNNLNYIEWYINSRFNGQKEIEAEGEIYLEIGYHYGRKRIYLEVYKEIYNTPRKRFHASFGSYKLFTTIQELRGYIKQKYNLVIKIPERSLAALKEKEVETKPQDAQQSLSKFIGGLHTK